MKPVFWLDEAVKDLSTIGDYIAQESPQAAHRVLLHIKASGDNLSFNPEIGRAGRVEGTYELILSDIPYILPYVVTKDSVQILAVLHSSRKWPDSFTKLH